MKSVLRIIIPLWAIAFLSFIVIKFVVNENELPEIAISYATNFEYFLQSFLSSSWFLIFFIFVWFGASYSSAKSSGWIELAKLYNPNYPSNVSAEFVTINGSFGDKEFGNVLRCAADEKGFYFKVIIPFSFGHKKLFIPWYDIEEITCETAQRMESSSKLLSKLKGFIPKKKNYVIKLSKFPNQYIRFSEKDFEYFQIVIPSNIVSGV